MTDEQIIKALECCATDDGDDCSQCPYGNIVYKPGNGGCVNRCRKDALDLINRQKAKNEREINQIKSEAIKEFAERLKRTSIGLEIGDDKKFKMTVVSTVAIENLVKEMTEVQE